MSEPDVRVRLSAEGIAEVVAALRKVGSEAKSTATSAERSFGGLNSALRTLKTTLMELAPALTVAALVDFARRSSEAADATGKAAQSVGASVRAYSALTYAAKTADVPLDALQTSMARFAKASTEAVNGSKSSQAAFAQLGIRMRDLEGLDTAQQLDLVARAFVRLQDSPAKTALVMQIFGRSGAQLIPLLNELGAVGLEGVIRKASELGLVLDQQTITRVQQLNDNFTTLGAQAQAAGAQLMSGFAEPMNRVLIDWQRLFGSEGGLLRSVGWFIGKLVEGFNLVVGSIGDAFDTLFRRVELNAKASWQSLRDFWRHDPDAGMHAAASKAAVDELNSGFDTRIKDRVKGFFGASNKTYGPEWNGPAPSPVPPPTSPGGEDPAVRRERLRQQALSFIYRQMEAEGQSHAVRMIQIVEDSQRYERTLLEQGHTKEQAHSLAADYRSALEGQEKFSAAQEQARLAFAELDTERRKIQSDVQAGWISEAEGQRRIAEIEAARLPNLRAMAEALTEAARATGNPATIQAAEQWSLGLRHLGEQAKETGSAFGWARSTVEDFFASGINRAHSFIDVLGQLGLALASALQRQIALNFTQALFGGGSGAFGVGKTAPAGFASGGYVAGPGSSTSDSVFAMLSNGEYVVRAAVVDRPGLLDHLEQINDGLWTPEPGTFSRSPLRGYADGGVVQPAAAASATIGGRVEIGLDEGLILRAIESPAGQEALLRVVGKNRRAIGAALG